MSPSREAGRRIAPALPPDPGDADRLASADLDEPQRVLGPHPAVIQGRMGVIVRAFHPEAINALCVLPDAAPHPMEPVGPAGLFAVFLPERSPLSRYRLRLGFPDGHTWEIEDPYRFPCTLGELDLYLFREGTHRRLWEVLGARPRLLDGVEGVSFAVWAPNARRVSVVGDFCFWDGRIYPMRRAADSGIFELFIPEVGPGEIYKYELKTREGSICLKTDPFARAMEHPPGTASRVVRSAYRWEDADWMRRRPERDPLHEPMAIYEVHLGSWARVPEEGDRPLSYREIAPRLGEHVKRLGFTHVELLPITEHPFDGSWGYQVSGYYAPTARYGAPDDFRYLVDVLHRCGIGVVLDWVPSHFPRDDFALRRFDGTPLYEYADPRLGEHQDWGTLVFDYVRPQVRNFLVANALYWLKEFHVDGLRVDAVASMLYRDYGRTGGEWLPNLFGGRENLEAVDFLRALNAAVKEEYPGCFTIAEESTAWPGVTRPESEGGLGFTFKWNLGWMHDTLGYFARDPIHRRYHQNDLTFASLYEHTEHFVMPLSHDEVVHGKRSLLEKMWGDRWQKFANLRLLLAYQFTRPGKKLLFMGTELAQEREWEAGMSLDWHLAEDPSRAGLARLIEALGRLYHEHPCLWRSDAEPEGFAWIDCSDHQNSVLSYLRRSEKDELVVVANATPVPRIDYRIGAPRAGRFVEKLSTDAPEFGGGGFATLGCAETEPVPFHGFPQSLNLRLPPLGCLVLAHQA